MFVGALNQKALAWLAQQRECFAGRQVVVGCSGSFSTELMLLQKGVATAGIHGNDVSLYSYVLGEFLCGRRAEVAPRADAPAWLHEAWKSAAGASGVGGEDSADANAEALALAVPVAVMHILLDMLPFQKQRNPHQRRMWDGYARNLGALVMETAGRAVEMAGALPQRMTSFTLGDVFEHFQAHDTEDAIFVCYAPTYTGGYEKMYGALHALFEWTPPSYNLLDEKGRDALLAWCRDGRRYVWYDDRKLEGESPVLLQERGEMRTVYLYSNLIDHPGYFGPYTKRSGLALPLANEKTTLKENDRVELLPMKTSDLADYKDQFLSKEIDHSPGTWAFAVVVGGGDGDHVVVGFMEFARSKFGGNDIYVNSDFAVPGTQYARLSKLIVMLMRSANVRKWLERRLMNRVGALYTTAFTQRPVSMKYRGVFELVKRGEKPDGRKYLNYEGKFVEQNLQEVYGEWYRKHGKTTSTP
jgi:hypothetical protein